MIQFMSNFGCQLPDDLLPIALKSENVQPFPSHPAYAIRLASTLRLRMLQDKQHHTGLQQAKLVAELLELQESGVNEWCASAFTQWGEAAT